MRAFLLIFILICTSACQVKEEAEKDEVLNEHRSAPNAFTVIPPTPQSYFTGDTLTISLKFPTTVYVDTSFGTSYLLLNFGSYLVIANYVSGDGTDTLSFEYAVGGTDLDVDGVDIHSMTLNGAAITFLSGSNRKNCNTVLPATHLSGVLINAI